MTAQLIDGRKVARVIRDDIRTTVTRRVKDGFRRPGLAVVLVGSDPASQIYVHNKRAACEEAGR